MHRRSMLGSVCLSLVLSFLPTRAAAPAAAGAGPAGPPLLFEVRRATFDPPLVADAALGQRHVALAGLLYVLAADRTIHVIDGTTGTRVGQASHAGLGDTARAGSLAAVTWEGRSWLIVHGVRKAILVFDLRIAREPRFQGEVPVEGPLASRVLQLPGRPWIAVGAAGPTASRVHFVDLRDLASTWSYELPAPDLVLDDVAGGPAATRLVFRSATRVNVFEVRGAGEPGGIDHVREFRLASLEWSALDEAGEILVLVQGPREGGVTWYEASLRGVTDGRLFSTFRLEGQDPERRPLPCALVGGGGARALVAGFPTGTEVHDLSDVLAPHRVAQLPLNPFSETWDSTSPRRIATVVASATKPLAFVAVPNERRVVAVDVRDGSIPAEWSTTDGRPVELALDEPDEQTRRLGVLGDRLHMPEAGRTDVRQIDWSRAAAPVAGRPFVGTGVGPQVAIAPLGGRYVLAGDAAANTFHLYDTATGDIRQTIGNRGEAPLALAGTGAARTAAIDALVYDLVEGRLVQRGPYPRALASRVLTDGTLVAIERDRLRVVAPDGTVSVLDLDQASRYTRLALTHDEALAAPFRPETPRGSVPVIDVIDRDAPLRRASLPEADGLSLLTRNRAFVAATYDRSAEEWVFAPRLFDTLTGAPVGPALPPEPGVLEITTTPPYTGPDPIVVLLVSGADGWRLRQYATDDTMPRLLSISQPVDGRPVAVLRRSMVDLYVASAAGGPWQLSIAEPDGAVTARGTLDIASLVPLRHGFLAAAANTPGTIVILRDPELNRPPVPVLSGPRDLECAGPGGTRVQFDASGSFDPDSSPGTEDDLAGFRWNVDHVPAGDGRTLELRLSSGEHLVGLTAIDVLGAAGSTGGEVHVRDTLPPSASITLDPAVENGRFAQRWRVATRATDVCDGEAAGSVFIALEPALLAGEPDYAVAKVQAVSILTRSGRRVVRLEGPDRAVLERTWAEARARGGLALRGGSEPIGLRLVAGAGNVLARYTLDGAGHVIAADAFGPRADHVVRLAVRDRAGLESRAEASLRARIAEICAAFPDDLVCAPRHERLERRIPPKLSWRN